MELRGVQPYFPLAFAVSPEEPLLFNFESRVLDGLHLPCALPRADAVSEPPPNEPVNFSSAGEAIGYLRQGISEWEKTVMEGRQPAKERPVGHGAPLSRRALFHQEGRPLVEMLTSGKAELDRNLDQVRLDR